MKNLWKNIPRQDCFFLVPTKASKQQTVWGPSGPSVAPAHRSAPPTPWEGARPWPSIVRPLLVVSTVLPGHGELLICQFFLNLLYTFFIKMRKKKHIFLFSVFFIWFVYLSSLVVFFFYRFLVCFYRHFLAKNHGSTITPGQKSLLSWTKHGKKHEKTC